MRPTVTPTPTSSATRANAVAQYTRQVVALQTSIAKLQASVAGLSPAKAHASAADLSIASLTQSVQQLQATSQLVAQTGPSVIQRGNRSDNSLISKAGSQRPPRPRRGCDPRSGTRLPTGPAR